MNRSATAGKPRRTARWTVPSLTFLALFATWTLIVATLEPAELVTGTGAAALGTVAVEALRRSSSDRGHVRLRWLGIAARALFRIPQAFARVASTLVRPRSEGTFQILPFPVRGHDRWSVGRRVATLYDVSLPPDAYVVDFDVEGSTVLVHTLGGRRLSEDDLRMTP